MNNHEAEVNDSEKNGPPRICSVMFLRHPIEADHETIFRFFSPR